ncbi:MAG TPA: hypothetical protein VF365_09520 [Candidatus Limnocylindria bacterium]
MRWALAAAAIVVPVVLGIAAWLLLPPPTSGNGWRTDPGASWHEPLLGDPGDGSRAIAYPAGDDEIGIGVTVFGSSSCPPRLRDLRIGSVAIEVEVRGDPLAGACTADLAAHPIGILVRPDVLPAVPFTVIVHHAGAVDETEIAELP